MTRFSPKAYFRQQGTRLRTIHQRNLSTLRSRPWHEISGAFGDIGTFIPIFVALSSSSFHGLHPVISPASTLVVSGLANILTGIFFGIPLPVQPMKAIAAVVIASPRSFTAESVASAGLFTAAVIAVLSASGAVQWFTRTMPIPIVKGVQVSAGLSLTMSGIKMLDRAWNVDGATLILTSLLLLLCTLRPRYNFAGIAMMVLFLMTVASLVNDWIVGYGWFHGPNIWHPSFLLPTWPEFQQGAFDAGLGQIPLTALNSIVAVVFLAEDLLPEVAAPSATAIGLSVAAMNLVGCWFSAMPVCHGSGGLAAQYRFGARSGASIVFLGTLKIVLGLFFSRAVLQGCDMFPESLLLILLVLAGLELVKMGENVNGRGAIDLWEESAGEEGEEHPTPAAKRFVEPTAAERTRRYTLMMVTTAATLATQNAGIGFLAGVGLWAVHKVEDWDARRREGQVRLEEGEMPAPAPNE